ncbi:hypothetical protein B0H13DRAFT_1868357 [Mycena leptocephala]|nr:hypothetical protein B0H13DRAFT_1868357 [Mycena leptocephala]
MMILLSRKGTVAATCALPDLEPSFAMTDLLKLLQELYALKCSELAEEVMDSEQRAEEAVETEDGAEKMFRIGYGGFVTQRLHTIRYEAHVYRCFGAHNRIPRVMWRREVLVLDLLSPTLEQLRRVCRGTLSMWTRRGAWLRFVLEVNQSVDIGSVEGRSELLHIHDNMRKVFEGKEWTGPVFGSIIHTGEKNILTYVNMLAESR